MSRGLGRIERTIQEAIRRDETSEIGVLISSWHVVGDVFHPGYATNEHLSWEPSRTQQAAVARAMRSFVRKFPRFALMGGARPQAALPLRHHRPGQRRLGAG